MKRTSVSNYELADHLGSGSFRLAYTTLKEEDLEWLSQARYLELHCVKFPKGLTSRLINLRTLIFSGGSAEEIDDIGVLTNLECLTVSSIRNLQNLFILAQLTNLRCLSLENLSHIENLPSLYRHIHLVKIKLRNLSKLDDLISVLGAPKLQELFLVNKVKVDSEDILAISAHPSLQKFSHIAENAPQKYMRLLANNIKLPPIDYHSFGLCPK